MQIEEFQLERIQSLYENEVDYNLTESGVHPFTLRELLEPDELEGLLDLRLGYGWTNGAPELRDVIAALYPGATREQVLVTNGSAEANFLAMWSLLEPGDELVLMLPNYMQIAGLARSLGARVVPFHLREERGWAPDLEQLERALSPRTRAIAICAPNNPTGALLSDEERAAIVALARRAGCWLYADEVYRGVELDGRERPSFRGETERAIVAGGLSKALSHPGLRLGWLVGPAEWIADAWHHSDYTTIAPGLLSQRIATHILQPARRESILERNRTMLRENLALLRGWMAEHEGLFDLVPPAAGGMAFLRYHLELGSSELCERLRLEKSTFVIAGDCFGLDHHLRIGIGSERDYLAAGLERVAELLGELR